MQKLSYRNNWEDYTFYVGKESLKSITSVTVDGEKYVTTPISVLNEYHDMGHTYKTRTIDYTITKKTFGKNIVYRLTDLLDSGVSIYID